MIRFGTSELIHCYKEGLFPMAESRHADDIYLLEPEMRGIIPLGGLKISRSLAKTVRSRQFEIRINTAFARVINECAAPRKQDDDSWISSGLIELYCNLHRQNKAHSVECWQNGELVGGLYGVHLGAAFFGESMFSKKTDASKTALVHLVARMRAGGFFLLDTQFLTSHLKSLGGVEISKEEYRKHLKFALSRPGDFFPYGFSDSEFAASVSKGTSAAFAPRQSKTQTS